MFKVFIISIFMFKNMSIYDFYVLVTKYNDAVFSLYLPFFSLQILPIYLVQKFSRILQIMNDEVKQISI